MSFQDWEKVVIGNGKNKKANTSIQHQAGHKEFMKLNEDDIPKLDKITPEQSKNLREARNARGILQSELAKSLNIDISIIRDYENGNVKKFNPTLYKSLMRKLGVK